MDETFTYNDERFQQQFEALHDALISNGRYGDAATIVEDESRLFLKQAIAITPPKTKQQGEGAIARDLSRGFTIVEDDVAEHIAADFGTDHVRHWLTGKKGQRYEVEWEKLDVQGYGMDRFHADNRKPDGHMRSFRSKKISGTWTAKYVVSRSAFNAYFAKLKEHVGKLKSGWLRAYYEVGGKLPSWIQRQAGLSLGDVKNELNVPGRPHIVIINRADGIEAHADILATTFRLRANSIRRRIKLLASNYAKDVIAGTRISKHERRSAD